MVFKIKVLQSPSFKKAVKKLRNDQKSDLDGEVKTLLESPSTDEQKKDDLSFMKVYKFKMAKQLTLLDYSCEDGALVLELMALGTHKNFQRDVKKLF